METKVATQTAVSSTARTTEHVALYARANTQDTVPAGDQLLALRSHAASKGWRTIEYVDDNPGTGDLTSSAMNNLMTAARHGRLAAVAVYGFEFLAHDEAQLLSMMEELAALHIRVVSLCERDDLAQEGCGVARLIRVVMRLRRAGAQARVREGLARARARGTRLGRPRVEIDVGRAANLVREGLPLKRVSAVLGVNRSTLRCRLQEAGLWASSNEAHSAA